MIIATRDRRTILCETLARLESQAEDADLEVIVVDDGSHDGTADAVERLAAESDLRLTLLRQENAGPGAARNRALAVAKAPLCLFIDDDSWPLPGLVARHRDFHADHPEEEAALLGHIGLPETPAPTPLMRWMAEATLDFAGMEDPSDIGGRRFFTGNLSAKTGFLLSVGGFDASQRPAHEDIDLGLRLEERGLRLAYDPHAAVEHYQPIDLPAAIARNGAVGRSDALLAQRHPGRPRPRRAGARHRMKAAALTVLAVARVRTPAVRRETWRFLCHQAHREAYWHALDEATGRAVRTYEGLRIGRTLARLASRDAAARLPADRPPGPSATATATGRGQQPLETP